MKKICYVTTLSVSIRAFFAEQLQYLSENGFDVTVICSPDEALSSDLGERIHYIPVAIPRGIHPLGMLRAIRTLKRIFRKEKFDLVQYSTPNAAFCGAIAAKAAKIPVRNYHLMGLRYLGDTGVKRKILFSLEKLACARSTSVECVSPSNLALATASGLFPAQKGTVVWNGSSGGLDIGRFDVGHREEYRQEIRARYGIPADAFVFGFVGRITRDKGVNELLRAFAGLENARLLMVGNEDDVGGLDEMLYKSSRENAAVIYTGQVSDVERYYAAMDVLVFPSYREGFGNVVMEAAAMGTPAVISRIPGPIDAVKEGITALTVPPKDEKALLGAMEEIRKDGRYLSMSADAVSHVRACFDSKILNEKILARKNALLKG